MPCGVGAPPAAIQAREAEMEGEPWAERPGLGEGKGRSGGER